jgi:MYXO-CTERM domain-containing protein
MSLTLRAPRPALLAAALTAGALTLGEARDASACGGFFCSSSPIDQTAEHILFSVNPDRTITAYVQIQYSGDRDGFAWIVPAPGVPTLSADFPDLALRALDAGTQPRYFKNACYGGPLYAAAGSATDGGAVVPTAENGVTVLAHQIVGPFDTVTLEGTSADVLVKWLKDHQYRFTDSMIPILQPYVEGGLHFVAARLVANKDTSDIKPLVMTYAGSKPMIPLRLTSVAAQPEMGIVTWILSDQRWAPENFQDLKIPDELIEFGQYGNQNNYLTLVSREADKVGGEAFVTEYAKPTADIVQQIQGQGVPSPEAQAAKDAILPVLQKFPYITRLYARMSAEDMRDDPTFMPAADQTDVDNVHDLSDPKFDYSMCSQQAPPQPDPCTFTYCGRRGVCVPTLASAVATGSAQTAVACVCANDATARATTTGSQPAPYCEPVAMNLDAAGSGAPAPLLQAACEGFDCGAHGKCVAMNGNPTCQCEGGYGAVTTPTTDPVTGAPGKTLVTCELVGSNVPAFPVLPPVGQTRIPTGGSETQGGCSAGSGAPRSRDAASVLGLAGLGLAFRRRRRPLAS